MLSYLSSWNVMSQQRLNLGLGARELRTQDAGMQQLTRLFWFSSLALPAGELRQWHLALASYSNKTKYLNLMSGEVKSPVWGSPKGRTVQDQGADRLWVRSLPCPSTDTFILCLDVTEGWPDSLVTVLLWGRWTQSPRAPTSEPNSLSRLLILTSSL